MSKSNRFTKDAVIYACKKMSSFTSDVRKILDVLRFALEEKVEGQIGIDDIVKCWRAVCHEEGGMWQEQLPEFYRNITNALKQEGGVTSV